MSAGAGLQATPSVARSLTARQLRMYRGGFLVVLGTESIFFVTLFAVRFLIAGTGRPAELEALGGAAITAVFALSAVPAGLALRAIRAGEVGRMRTNAATAFALGLLALGLIVSEMATRIGGLERRFAEIFGATAFIHGVHIVIGLLFLAAIWSAAGRGRFSAGDHWVVEAAVRFWWFVTLTWLGVYVVFYLL